MINYTEFIEKEKWNHFGENDNYSVLEDDEVKVYFWGCMFEYSDGRYNYDVLDICRRSLALTFDFSLLHGYFKVLIIDKKVGRTHLWGDNSGSMGFFVCPDKGIFSTSLLGLKEMLGEDAKPSYKAIVQLFNDMPYGNRTIVEGINFTGGDNYFIFDANGIKKKAKNLKPFSKSEGFGMDVLMDGLTACVGKDEVSAVCTGGTDSRTILAHLLKRKIPFSCVLSGHDTNPDIPIAKELAAAANAPLTIIDPSSDDPEWLEKAFVFSDGFYDPVLSYRHYKISTSLKAGPSCFQFGGVGGEFYKNDYCQFVRNALFVKKQSPKLIYDIILRCESRPWFGDNMNAVLGDLEKETLEILEGQREKGLLNAFNRVGFSLLREKYCWITNNIARSYTKIEPLMDRSLIIGASKDSPVAHSMNVWQRQEVCAAYPEISKIETDRGYNCSTDAVLLAKDTTKRLGFYAGRVLARVQRKLGFKNYKDVTQRFWDNDFEKARSSEIFQQSFETCRKFGIIKPDATHADIPAKDVGIIIQIGMMFR